MRASESPALPPRIDELTVQLAIACEETNRAIARQSELFGRIFELLTVNERLAREPMTTLPVGVRGPRIIAVLAWLAEAGDRGLSPSEIVAVAENNGVPLNASSMRSQLSRAVRKGWISRRHGRYYASSSANASDEAPPPNPA